MPWLSGDTVKFAFTSPDGHCSAISDSCQFAPKGHQIARRPNGQISVCQNLTGYGWAINGLFLGYFWATKQNAHMQWALSPNKYLI
jgi:hypothetical protein